jgi:hypothetical protein
MLGVPNNSQFWRFLKNAQTKDSEWLIYTPKFRTHRYFYIDMKMSYEEYSRKFKASTLQKFRHGLPGSTKVEATPPPVVDLFAWAEDLFARMP